MNDDSGNKEYARTKPYSRHDRAIVAEEEGIKRYLKMTAPPDVTEITGTKSFRIAVGSIRSEEE